MHQPKFLKKIGKTGIPTVLSTGMATLEEIDTAVNTLKNAGCPSLKLLHCISFYPVPLEQCNLQAIKTLRDRYHCQVGWSDHSVQDIVIQRAVHHWNAAIIEFHLDLDGTGPEYGFGHCWLPENIKKTIESIQLVANIDGNGRKAPQPGEMRERDWRADPSDGLRPLRKTRENWVPD